MKEILKELEELLEIDNKQLSNRSKKIEYIKKVLDKWQKLDDSSKDNDLVLRVLEKVLENSGDIIDFLNFVPSDFKDSDFYSRIVTSKYASNYGSGVYKLIYEEIPEDIKTPQLLINYVKKLDELKIFVEFIKLKPQFNSEQLYGDFLRKFSEKRFFGTGKADFDMIIDIVPKEYLSEESMLALIKNLSGNNKTPITSLLKKINDTKVNFSQDFYNTIIKTYKEENSSIRIYRSIPQQYKTKELVYEAMKTNANSPYILQSILNEYLENNSLSEDNYIELIDIINKNTNNDNIKLKSIACILNSIYQRKLPNDRKRLAVNFSTYTVNLFKTAKAKKGNLVYTPKNAIDMFYTNLGRNNLSGGIMIVNVTIDESNEFHKKCLDNTQLLEYLSSIIASEEKRILRNEENIKQIKEYEREVLEYDKNIPLQKNKLWPLKAIYKIIPEELQYNFKDKIDNFIKNNIDILNNGRNENVIELLKQMCANNEDLFFYIDDRFINSDKYLNLFGKEKFEILANFPEIQNMILKLDDVSLKIFTQYINYAQNQLQCRDNNLEDWIPVADILLNAFENEKFRNLNESIRRLNFEQIPEEIKEKYLHIISKEENWFDIRNIEDINNYEQIRDDICRKLLNNPYNLEGIPNSIRNLSVRERMIFARLQLQFGIDFNEAKNLVNKYALGLNDDQKKEGIGLLLLSIKKILDTDDNDLNKLNIQFDNDISSSTNYMEILNLESKCRESYMRQYQEVVYSPTKKYQDLVDYNAHYNGKEIQVFEPHENFQMIIHALGAYSDKVIREDYKKDWNKSRIKNHGLCTSFISNNNLGTARVIDIIYGFDIFSPEQMLLCAPWDIVSTGANTMFSSSSVKYDFKNGVKFMAPEEQINNTRYTHNEIVLERRYFSKGNLSKKMQPSYIVYNPDYLEGKSTQQIDSIMLNREEYLKEYMKNDPRWIESQKAAAQFDIPIVILDRAWISYNESLKLEEKMNNFEATKDISIIPQIINAFENNRSGNRIYHNTIYKKWFSEIKLEQYINRMKKAIEELPTQSQKREVYEMLKRSFESEIEKRKSNTKTGNDSISHFWEEHLSQISAVIEKYKNISDIRRKIGIENLDISVEENNKILSHVKNKSNIYSDVKMYSQLPLQQIIDSAMGFDHLFDKAKEVQSNNHSRSKVHGVQHVKNVLLISTYLGKKDKISDEDLKILQEAAIYHDICHKKGGDPTHAKEGALHYLKNAQSSLNKNEVAFLIEAHELKNNEQFKDLVDEYFPDKSGKRKMELIKIAKILQDADRLDILRYDIENPYWQRFEPYRLNDSNNTKLISAVIELNARQAVASGFLKFSSDRKQSTSQNLLNLYQNSGIDNQQVESTINNILGTKENGDQKPKAFDPKL